MTIMHTSNAERMYYERNPKAKKERESLEDKNYRLSRMYNNCSCVISEIKNRTDYKKAQELINSYADETDSQLDIYRLNKLLFEKIASLLQQNDENMKKIQKEIADIKSIQVEESTEQLQKLPYKFLRHLIIEQNKIPYLKINAKYYINYQHFLNYIDELN